MTDRTIIEQAAEVMREANNSPEARKAWSLWPQIVPIDVYAEALQAAGLLRDPVKEAAEPIMVQLLCLLDPTGEHSMAELMRRLAIADRALACESDGHSVYTSRYGFDSPDSLLEWLVGSGVSTTGAET